jgi:hypothetical protein
MKMCGFIRKHWRFRRSLLVVLLLLAGMGNLHADLGAFQDFIEKAGTEGETGGSSGGGGGHSNGLAELFAQLLYMGWIYNNCYIRYMPYPYYDGGYIRRPWNETYGQGQYAAGKDFWLSTSVSGIYMVDALNDSSGGSWVSLSGNLFRFFGPYFDAFVLSDSENTLGGFRAGGQFSLMQFEGFQMSMYMQYQHWTRLLDFDAFVFGVEMRFYPAEPLSLRFKAGMQMLENNVALGEIEGEVGFLFNAWELFAGYRYWNTEDGFHLPNNPFPMQGPYLGIRRYF